MYRIAPVLLYLFYCGATCYFYSKIAHWVCIIYCISYTRCRSARFNPRYRWIMKTSVNTFFQPKINSTRSSTTIWIYKYSDLFFFPVQKSLIQTTAKCITYPSLMYCTLEWEWKNMNPSLGCTTAECCWEILQAMEHTNIYISWRVLHPCDKYYI